MSVVVGVECTGSGFSNEEILNVRFPLHRACRDGDVGALCALLQRCTDTVHLNAEDSVYGWSPIHWAAHFGKLECVMRLVQVGCEVNAVTTKFAQTPAHIAAFGGHPDCVLWLLQAGADVNRQDYVGETPIHKAARAGSMECIKALLLQGAKPHLRNASGLTAADLAHAQGFHECSQLLTNAQNHLIQLNGFHANGTLNGNTNLCPGQLGLPSRKRLLNDAEVVHVKKARTDGLDVSMRMLQNGGGGGDDPESMHVEESMHSEEDPKAMSNGHSVPNSGSTTANGHYDAATPRVNGVNGSASSDGVLSARWNSTTAPPPHRRPAKSELSLPLRREESWSGQTTTTTAAAPRCPTDMCGSLHLTESPSSCVAYRPTWGGAMGSSADSAMGDSLHYGHYHGFGDTAEDLTESTGSRLEHSISVYAEQHYNQAMVNNFHGS